MLNKSIRVALNARAELRLHPGSQGYFLPFFDFLAFFAFFAFFAFLAIVSSQGLMDGNATRGMLGGGPASQYPRTQSQQIRGALPPTVTPVSSAYPQLLCFFAVFSPSSTRHRREHSAHGCFARAIRVNDTPMQHRAGSIATAARALHQFKTTASIAAPR